MEAQLAIAGFVGLVVGWNARGFFPEKEEAPACSCLCNCHHNVTSSEAASWFQPGLVVASLVVLITIAANLALVFRVSWVSKGDERELAFVVSHQKGQGKSRGTFGSPKGLQIQG